MDVAPRILVVNDSTIGRYTISEMLRRDGLEVLEAASGLEALERVLERPDLVVLDVKLPDIDGFEVCRRIRANPQTATVKVLSTSATFVTIDNKVQGLQAGADAYLTQPFEPEELLAMVHNLLKLARTERELEARTDHLIEVDRRKDEFLAMLAHELRNPLAAITACMPILTRQAPAGEPDRRAREVVLRQLSHLGRLVDDLLDVARVTQGKITLDSRTLDLTDLVAGAVESLRRNRSDARRQVVRIEAPSTPIHVEGDAGRLEQVVSNVLENASKYSHPGGEITVALATDAETASLVVRDRGVGIEADVLPTIFDLFSQGEATIDRSRGGLGVGLTLVRQLMELHGGTVVARSEGVGKGSTFELRLPCSPHVLPESEPKPPLTGSQPRRLLLVEDNADARTALATLCEMWGHTVSVAEDGHAGVARALAEQPEVSLIDIGLPGIDGYEVARRIRADPRGRDLVLIALTGYGTTGDVALAREAGFDLHFVKPFDPDDLERLLSTGVVRSS